MPNAWITHLKKFRASHPGLTLGQAMKQAKGTYKKTTKELWIGISNEHVAEAESRLFQPQGRFQRVSTLYA